ncbi:MAG: GHKL domain-containing protein, partial [Bdellovibrionales bacterium]|nr:GHKL domain-containing protein [Bdellovibrionales bacterium]
LVPAVQKQLQEGLRKLAKMRETVDNNSPEIDSKNIDHQLKGRIDIISSLLKQAEFLEQWPYHAQAEHALFILIQSVELLSREHLAIRHAFARKTLSPYKVGLLHLSHYEYKYFLKMLPTFSDEKFMTRFNQALQPGLLQQMSDIRHHIMASTRLKEPIAKTINNLGHSAREIAILSSKLINPLINLIHTIDQEEESKRQIRNKNVIIRLIIWPLLFLLACALLFRKLFQLIHHLHDRLATIPSMIGQLIQNPGDQGLLKEFKDDELLGRFYQAVDGLIVNQLEYQKDLEEQHRHTISLVDSLDEMLLVIDPSGIIQLVNRTVCNYLNYSPQELVGSHISKILSNRRSNSREDDSLKELYSSDQLICWAQEQQLNDVAAVLQTADKSEAMVQVILNSSLYINADKKVIEIIITARLAEESKMLELLNDQTAQLVQTAKLASIGEMSASIGHEINNPTTIILGKLAAMKGECQDENSKLSNMIDSATLHANRIDRIIKGLKQLSHSSSSENLTESIYLSDLIEGTLSICREKFKSHGVSMKVTIPIDIINIECNQVQLSQVLLNLFNNSYHAVEQCATKEISLTASMTGGNNVRILIEDSGPGIPEDIKVKLFTPFFTTKKKGVGTGLGLSISRRIITKHGGTIELDQSVKQTRFIITLPTIQS